MAHAVAGRCGPVAGHVAGAALVVNPLAARHYREVRGYSLVTLAAVVATLLLFAGLSGRRPANRVAYGASLAAAMATHLFAVGLLVAHVLVATAPRSRPVRPWVGPWAAALGAGLVFQVPAITEGLGAPPRYRFVPDFPVRLAVNLLGGPALPAVLVLVAVGWTVLRQRPWVTRAAAGVAAMVGGTWLAAPYGLDSRFFMWLLPAPAVAAGVGVARRPRLAWLAAAGVAVQLVAVLPQLPRDEVPNRIAAGFVRAAQRRGAAPCALGRTRASLLAYVVDVPVVREPHRLPACDLAVEAAGPTPEPLTGAACRRFAFVLVLPARHPGALFSDAPLEPVPEWPRRRAPEWRRTAESRLCSPPA